MLGVLLVIAYICVNNISKRQNIFVRIFHIFLFTLIFLVQAFAHNGSSSKLIYIENKGQWHQNVRFKTNIRNGAIYLENNKITVNVAENNSHKFDSSFDFSKPCNAHAYNIEFLNSHPNPQINPEKKFEEYFNYFLGEDPSQWKGGCHGFEDIRYKDIYPHIDLVISSKYFQPKYTFYLRAGAKVSDIKMKFNGLANLYLNTKGDLVSTTVLGDVVDEKPITFLHQEGQIRDVSSNFILENNVLSFQADIKEISGSQVLEIDPQIIFSSYSGSTGDNFGASATYDFAGHLYGTGLVFATGYPTTTGAYQTTFGGQSDIGITKFSPSGNARVYSTYIGGTSFDVPHSLVVDQNNRLILLSTTSSTNFPTTVGAFRRTHAGGPALSGIPSLNGLGISYPNGADIVITKFNPTGTGLVGSTFFGGSSSDGVGISTDLVKNYGDGIRGEIETDTLGNIYLASLSNSNNLPTVTGGFKTTNSGSYDGILAKFNTNLTTLLSFTYIGGSGDDALYDLCFDKAGNIIAAGGTASSNMGATSGVVNGTYSGGTDGMVVSLNNNLTSLRYATYYGTSDYDQIYFVESGDSNKVYVLGQTTHSTTNYFLVSAAYSIPHTGQFVSVLNPTVSAKLRSTMFGRGNQNPDISPTAFLVDYCNKIFITGWGSNLGSFNTFSLSTSGLPVTSNAFQSTTLGNGFYMMILEGDLSALYYGSFFGGTTSLSQEHVDGGTSRFDKNGIVYHAVCAGCGGQQNFPIYPNAASVVGPSNNSSNCNLGVFKFDFGLPVKADFTYTPACAPANIKMNNFSHTVSANTQFFWLFSNGATSTVREPTITFTNSGIYSARLIVRDTTSCNIADTIIKTIVVLGTTADTLSNKTICAGSSVRIGFTNIKDTGMTFTWTPTSSIDDTSILSPFASPSNTTQYRLIINKTGCTDTFYQTVIVDTPKNLIIVGDNISCVGAKTLFTTNSYSQGNYDWLPKSVLTRSNRDTAEFTFTTLPLDITVNYTSLYGCISSTKKTIVAGTPTLTLEADTIGCKGDVITLLAKSNFQGGTFSFSPSISPIFQNGDTTRFILDTTFSLIVTKTISTNCIARDTIRFKLLKDQVNWQVDSIVCWNEEIVATAATHLNYTILWQPAATLVTPQSTSPARFNFSNTNRKVFIEATHNLKSYCQYKDSALVKFIDLFMDLTADTLKCKDSLVTIRHSSSKGANVQWSPASLLLNQTDTTATFRVPQTGFYRMTVVDNNCVETDSIRIRIINDFIKITGDSVICPGDTSYIQATLMNGATYQWTPFPPIIGKADTAKIKAKPSQSQYFYVHIQDTQKCYIFDSFYVRHLDTSQTAMADFTANTNCQNLSINFTNTSRAVSASPNYSWNFNGQGTSTQTNPSFTFTSYGLQNVTLIINDNLSCNKTDTIRKSIYILNNAFTTLPPIKSCKGDSIIIGLKGIIDPGATISWTPNSQMSGSTTFSPKVKVNTQTTFRAYLSKNGCTDTIEQTVLIDTPKPLSINGPSVVCKLEDALFTGTNYPNGVYQWEPFNLIAFQNRDSARLIINANTMVKVSYVSDYNCISHDSMQVQVVNAALNLQMDSIGCKDEILTINYSSNLLGGQYTFNPSSNIISQNATSAQFRVDTTRTINIEYRVNNACYSNKTISFKLLQDAVNWNPDTITCRGQSVDVSANLNSRWALIWNPNALLQTAQGVSPARFGPFSNDSSIYIQATLISRPACMYRDTARVRLFENLIQIQGPVSNCKDSFVRLSASLIPNTSYVWGPINALFNSLLNTAVFKTDVSRNYFVTARFKNQCTAVDTHFIFVGNPNLKLWADTVVCAGDTVSLNATQLNGASYQWSTGATTTKTIVTITQPTTYRLTVIDSNNCKLNDSLRIQIFNASIFKFLSRDSIVCKFDTVKLEVPNLSKVTYQWAPSQPILTGQGTSKIRAWINQDTKFYINANLNRGIGCSVIDSINMKKDTLFLKISGNKIVCKGDTLTLNANFNSTFTYNWNPTNWISNTKNIVRYKIIDSAMVRCIATSSLYTKCNYRDSIKVDYSRYLDDLRVTANPDKIEYGSKTILQASASNVVGYVWSPSKTLDNKFIPMPEAKPDTTTTYYVEVRDPLGCRSGDSVIVTVIYEICDDPEVFVPTGFTPNKDGKNDALYVMGDNIQKMQFMIYDRWGQLVFESTNQKKGWDGTYKGIELEPGVFAYHLYVECIGGANMTKKGNITILK
jgi:gliding motility-associated-like protein